MREENAIPSRKNALCLVFYLFSLALLENLAGHIEDGTTQVIAYSLHRHVEFVGYTMCCAVGQTVFQATKLVECDCLAHEFVCFLFAASGYLLHLLI